jgi:tRNA(fMet)-specific endonuclease VapC
MGRRLILDTNVLIAYERGTIDRAAYDEDELAIASASVAEYRVGIELADTPERAAERARALAAIMSAIDVMDYTAATAALHARPLAHVRRSGSRTVRRPPQAQQTRARSRTAPRIRIA